MRLALRSLFFLATLTPACAGTESGPSSDDQDRDAAEIECGSTTCGSGQFCLERAPSDLGPTGESTWECAQIPDGCPAASFCDCDAVSSTWEGLDVRGCTVATFNDEVTDIALTVSPRTCGSDICVAGEGCIVFAYAFSDPLLVGNNYCHPLPADCVGIDDFCATDCPQRFAESAGESFQSCSSLDPFTTVNVNEAP